jgi:hypothetical protein
MLANCYAKPGDAKVLGGTVEVDSGGGWIVVEASLS